jgi:hypothetical protein
VFDGNTYANINRKNKLKLTITTLEVPQCLIGARGGVVG